MSIDTYPSVHEPLDGVSHDLLARDPEDEAADKLGSYELGRIALGIPEPAGNFSADAMQARLDASNASTDVPMAPQGKSTGKYVHGPQLGEETAPVAEQRVSLEVAAVIKRNKRDKIDPLLHDIKMKNLPRKAGELQIAPDPLLRKYADQQK